VASVQYGVFRPPHVLVAGLILVSGCLLSCGSDSPTTPQTVTSLAVTCTPQTGSHQCSATATLPNGTTSNVTADSTWTSSNTNVATVSAGGLVTHRATGQTEIRATYGNVTASTTLNIAISIPAPSGSSVVINEFATRARDDQACGEFVEIRNDTSASVDVSGFRILSWNHFTQQISEFATVNPGTVLAPGCHYLIISSVGANSFGVTRDQSTTGGDCPMDDEGGIALTNPQGGVIDQVGLNSSSVYKEGTALARIPADALRQSYARTGNDTNNNASDFIFGTAAPLNSTASCAVR